MLKFLFSFLGLSATVIGAMNFILGPEVTGGAFAALLSAVWHTPSQLNGLEGNNLDSEMRFYSALWMAYGALALWIAKQLPRSIVYLRLMLFVFLAGGIGRVISYFAAGAPHPLYFSLMWIELVLPLALMGMSYATLAGRAPAG